VPGEVDRESDACNVLAWARIAREGLITVFPVAGSNPAQSLRASREIRC